MSTKLVERIIAKLLLDSFMEIEFNYKYLAESEKKVIGSEDTFSDIKMWIIEREGDSVG